VATASLELANLHGKPGNTSSSFINLEIATTGIVFAFNYPTCLKNEVETGFFK
jgi:hypothetical protein